MSLIGECKCLTNSGEWCWDGGSAVGDAPGRRDGHPSTSGTFARPDDIRSSVDRAAPQAVTDEVCDLGRLAEYLRTELAETRPVAVVGRPPAGSSNITLFLRVGDE